MHPLFYATLGSVFYAIAIYYAMAEMRRDDPEKLTHHSLPIFTSLGLLMHMAIISSNYWHDGAFNLSLFNAASTISAVAVLTMLVTQLQYPIHTLKALVLPVAIVTLLASVFFDDKLMIGVQDHATLYAHIMFSVIAYGVIILTTLQALLVLTQHRALHNKNFSPFIRRLPALTAMEALLFRLIFAGFILLSLALLFGFFSFDDMLEQRIAHKTVLSILGWITMLTLIIGRIQFGWRGVKSVKWVFASFILLMLGYFGSKLVIEYIL